MWNDKAMYAADLRSSTKGSTRPTRCDAETGCNITVNSVLEANTTYVSLCHNYEYVFRHRVIIILTEIELTEDYAIGSNMELTICKIFRASFILTLLVLIFISRNLFL
jgi:hypothetical protein